MYFNCQFNDGLVQVMCMASFSFNLNIEEAESIILKQSGVRRVLQL